MMRQSAFKAASGLQPSGPSDFPSSAPSGPPPATFSAADLQSAIAALQHHHQQQQQHHHQEKQNPHSVHAAAAAAMAAAVAAAAAAHADEGGSFLSQLPSLASPALHGPGGGHGGYHPSSNHAALFAGSAPSPHTPSGATGGGGGPPYGRSTPTGSTASGFASVAGQGGGGGGSWLSPSSASTPPASPAGHHGGFFATPPTRGPQSVSQMPPLYGTPTRGSSYSNFGRGGSTPGGAVYDMKSLTAAVNMAAGGSGEIRRIFSSATFRPRLPGLTKLVSQLTREGQWSKGLEVFDALDCVGLLPDTTITNAAISACDKGGQWEKALQIFYAMESWGLARDAITYSAVISALSKGRQWSLAIDVFNHMCDHNIECDAVTCCSLITALDKGGQWQLGEQVFFQMYADHPQFKVLLHCMDDDVAAVAPSVCTAASTGSGGAAGGSGAGNAAPELSRTASAAAETLLSALTGPVSAAAAQRRGGGDPSDVLSACLGADPAAGGSASGLYRTGSTAYPAGAMSPAGMARIDEEGGGAATAAGGGPTAPPSTPSGSKWRNVVAGDGGNAGGGGGGSYLDLWDRRMVARLQASGYPNVVIRSPASMSPAAASLQHHPHHQSPSSPAAPSVAGSGAGGGGVGSSLWSGPSNLSDIFSEAQSPGGPLNRSTSNLTSTSGPGSMPYSPASPHPGQRGLLRTSSLNTKKSAPNRVCCNALLAAYARATPTQWQRAIRLLELMWQIGGELCPDIVSYNTVIKACGNAGQVELGFKVYALMRRRGIEPTVATYGTLVCIAADAGASARVIEVWGWLRASGLEVHVTCANAYLAALIKQGEWDNAVSFFRSLLRSGGPCRPNTITFNTLMAGYLERRQPEQVVALFQELQGGCGLAPSVTTYSHLVAAYGMAQRWEDAFNVVAFVCRPDSTVRPNVAMFTSLFGALKEAAETAAAGAAIGDGAATAAAAAALLMLSRHMHDLRTLLKMYPHLHPDVSCHRAMIGAFAAVGEVDVCVELFNILLLMATPHAPPPTPHQHHQHYPPPSPTPTPPASTGTGSGGGNASGGGGGGPASDRPSSSPSQTPPQPRSSHGSSTESPRAAAVAVAGQGHQTAAGGGSGGSGSGTGAGAGAGSGGGGAGAAPVAGAIATPANAAVAALPPHLVASGPPATAGGVDSEVAAQVLGAICCHRAWDKAVQLLKVLQEHGPLLGAPVMRTVCEAMALDNAWTAAYSVLQMLCGPGPASAVLDELVMGFKEGGATELLFLALLAAKDEAGAWGEALSMFSWLRQVARSDLCCSPDLYRILYEVLVVRGGVEGLKHAIALCREAHEQGVLHWFSRPSPPPPGAPPSSVLPPAGCVVVLEGYSRIETIVTLLSWLAEVKTAAEAGVRLSSPWVDIIAPDSNDTAVGAAAAAGGAPHSGAGPSSGVLDSGEHVRPAIALVLEGRIGELLGVGQDAEPDQRALFPLHSPVRAYPGADPSRPGIIRVETESIYDAMGLQGGARQAEGAVQQQPV